MTIVALPLFKLELSYLVRHGRRWTALEHLLLWSMTQDARNLSDLRRGTAMPERLIVEALVNLVRVGWIELTTVRKAGAADAILFTANRRGREVARLEELPYAFDLVKRFAGLYIDRLTGTVLKEDQVQLRHFDQIDRQSALVLKPEYEKYDASPTLFFDSLNMRPDDHFERPLGHRIISTAQFAMVEAIGEHISELPEEATALREVILRRLPRRHWTASHQEERVAVRTSKPLTSRERFLPAEISEQDILFGGRDHRSELKRILKRANSIVYIHSTFVGGVIEAFIPDFIAAAERDVEIVLLWGERRDALKEEPTQSEVKGRLAYSKIPLEWRERIRFARDPTGSHAKVILADSGEDGEFEAVIGSCNWLSSDYVGLEISARVRDHHLVREIAGMLADLCRSPSGVWGKDVTTLLKIQDRCRRNEKKLTASGVSSKPSAILVLNDEHYAAVRDVHNASAHVVTIGCDLFGSAGETTVFEPLGAAVQEDKTRVRVLYQRPTEAFSQELEGTLAALRRPNFDVDQCPRLHGKFLVWNDEVLIITSFNWLAASTGPAHHVVNELGILIKDPAIAKSFVRRFEKATGIQLVSTAHRDAI